MFLFQSSQDKRIRQDVQNQMLICLRSSQQKSQDKYKKAMQTISKYIQNNNQKVIELVIDNIKSTIKDQEYEPVRKYQSIKLLRDLMKIQIKNKNRSLGKYVVKKILKRLTILASHRANSNDQDRGRDIFNNVKKDQEKYSILFLNQLLLSIQQWAKTWPGTSDGLKKQFNQAYKDLITNRVQFPKQIVKAPVQQPYRPQQANRNSIGYNNNGPRRQSKQSQRPQSISPAPKSQIKPKVQQKPKVKKAEVDSGLTKKDEKLNSHFSNLVNTLNLLIQTLNGSSQQFNQQIFDLLKSLVYQISQMIAKGNQFVAQTPEQQWSHNQQIVKILQTFEFDKSINKDIKIAQKKPVQFKAFRNKYIKKSNTLINFINQSTKQQTSLEQSNLNNNERHKKQQVSNVEPKQRQLKPLSVDKPVQKGKNDSNEMNSAKRLSIPKVRQENRFSSNSGLQNNWVIKEKTEFNSNSHKDQHQSHQKFRSFGIGGIGQQIKNAQSKDKQKSGFANKSQTSRQQKPKKQQQDKSYPTTQKNIPQRQQKQFPGQQKVLKNVTKIVQTKKNKFQTNPSEFNAFQLSNSDIQKKNQQVYFDQPSSFKQQQKNQIKQKHQKTKDMFNDTDFQIQVKVEKQKSEKSQNQQSNFFGDFGPKNQRQQQLPMGQRNPRRQRTAAGTTKNIQQNAQNPFQYQTNQNQDDSANNFSAFQKDKSSLEVTRSKGPNFYDQSTLKNNQRQQKKQSNDNPFEKSLQLNKSNLTTNRKNSFDDRNPNFWEGSNSNIDNKNRTQNPFKQTSNPFTQQRNMRNQDDRSQNKSKRSVNPFENQQVLRKSTKSINPFEQENKSQLSQKDRSQVRNFNMNQSFTKSQKSNPFETTSQNLAKKRNKTENPFKQSQIQGQFRPDTTHQFQSVSQRASFKKITGQSKNLDMSIENPFQTSKIQARQAQQQPKNRDSFKLSVKSQQKNEGFDFDQFENIGGNRTSVQTSHFPQRRQTVQSVKSIKSNKSNKQNPFATQNNPFGNKNSFDNKNSIQMKNSLQKSVHFSQFGDPNQSFNNNQNKNNQKDDNKSLNFSDFQNIAKKTQSGLNFSAFQNNIDKQQKPSENNKNQFSAFQVSKTSGNDFFRQTQKQDNRKQKQNIQDNKSKHSGFSGFGMNFDNKSEQKNNKSGVDWNEFEGFQKDPKTSKVLEVKQSQPGLQYQLNTDRSRELNKQSNIHSINKNQLKLNFSQNTSKYHSPQFAMKYNSIQGKPQLPNSMLTSTQRNNKQTPYQIQSSIKLQQFMPLQKKGFQWNPIGIPVQYQLSRVYNLTDYDIQQKKKQLQYYKQIYLEQKSGLQQSKEVYNRQRKKYISKIDKINQIINQKESYKKILVSLRQANHNKEEEIFIMNQKIRQVQQLKQKILQKQKLLFQKSKQFMRQQQQNRLKGRTNTNKWQIFNRNIKMLRQRQQQQNYESYSRYNNNNSYGGAANYSNNNVIINNGKSFTYSRA